jgi:hypothetical protein
MSVRRLLAATLALAAWPAAAQPPLKLPTTQGEIRSLLRETNDPMCLRCGVVTALRVLQDRGPDAGPQSTAAPLPGGSSLDPGVGSVPIGTTERARVERDRLTQSGGPRYEVTVRYDDGSYGRIELGHDPRLKPGDRVKVEGGSVERYP